MSEAAQESKGVTAQNPPWDSSHIRHLTIPPGASGVIRCAASPVVCVFELTAGAIPCLQFKVYLIIEGCVWLPAAYLFCYRFQPTLRFVRTDTGRRIVHAASGFLERHTPTTHASLAKLADRAQGAPAGRAAAEWALLNKVAYPAHVPEPSPSLSPRRRLTHRTGSGSDRVADQDVVGAPDCEEPRGASGRRGGRAVIMAPRMPCRSQPTPRFAGEGAQDRSTPTRLPCVQVALVCCSVS